MYPFRGIDSGEGTIERVGPGAVVSLLALPAVQLRVSDLIVA